jgi:hypothetical protein
MIVSDHPTDRWSVRCLGRWPPGMVGPILALQTRMAPTATKAVNLLTEKPKCVGTASPTSPTTAWAATALRRHLADSPDRKAARPLTTLGGEEPRNHGSTAAPHCGLPTRQWSPRTGLTLWASWKPSPPGGSLDVLTGRATRVP